MTAITAGKTRTVRATVAHVPLTRITAVELRKMVDTRSGFWLIASIAITAVLVTAGVILFTPDGQLMYSSFPSAIRVPVVVILPLVALLAVTSEWTQRGGLTTFTLVPHRRRVIAGKAIASVTIAIAAMALTFAVGALGNLVGAAVTGTSLVWDVTVAQGLHYVLGMVLSLAVGFMFGVLIEPPPGRSSRTSSTACSSRGCSVGSRSASSGSPTCSRGPTSPSQSASCSPSARH
jgi:hypothetical protein